MSAQVYSVPAQTEKRKNAFLEWKSINLSSKLLLNLLLLTCGGDVNYYKSVHHPITTRGNREHLGNLQNKSISSPFLWVSRYYALLDQIEGERKSFFEGCKKWGHILRLPPRALGCHKRWKSPSFSEIWNSHTPPLFFISLPNK